MRVRAEGKRDGVFIQPGERPARCMTIFGTNRFLMRCAEGVSNAEGDTRGLLLCYCSSATPTRFSHCVGVFQSISKNVCRTRSVSDICFVPARKSSFRVTNVGGGLERGGRPYLIANSLLSLTRVGMTRTGVRIATSCEDESPIV